MKQPVHKPLRILLGILIIASLLLAGPAHVLVHSAGHADGCNLCHFASPEPPRPEVLVFWLATSALVLETSREHVPEHRLPAQGNARAPPARV